MPSPEMFQWSYVPLYDASLEFVPGGLGPQQISSKSKYLVAPGDGTVVVEKVKGSLSGACS
jgi:hypothetical protein